MDRRFSQSLNASQRGASSSSGARQFAAEILGRSVPHATPTEVDACSNRSQLEWLASVSTQHEHSLRRLVQKESRAYAKVERKEWLAAVSTVHEADWDPNKHPRRGGPPNAGWFATTGETGGAGTALNHARSAELKAASLHEVPPRMLELADAWWQRKAQLEKHAKDIKRLRKQIANERAQSGSGRFANLHKRNRERAERDSEMAKSEVPKLEKELRDLEQQYRAEGYDDIEYTTWTPAEMHHGGRGIEQVGRAVQVAGMPTGVKPTGVETDIALGALTAGKLGKAVFKGSLPRASKTATREIHIDSKRFPQSAQHLDDAGALNRPLPVNRAGASANRANALRGKQKVPGMDLDEAPPAVLRLPEDPVSVRPINRTDNRGAGASIGRQLRGVPSGQRVIIRRRPGGKK